MEKPTNGTAVASSWFKNDHFGGGGGGGGGGVESEIYSQASSIGHLQSSANTMSYNCLDYQFFTNAYASHHYHNREHSLNTELESHQDSPPHSTSADSCDKSSSFLLLAPTTTKSNCRFGSTCSTLFF